MIGIIDYRMGNLRSVQKALQRVGGEAHFIRTPGEFRDCDKIVLPGVGAFGDGMTHLREQGLVEPIRHFIDAGRLFLGICLGAQLLFEGSEEDATPGTLVPGLGVFEGSVRLFHGAPFGAGKLKVPHMGWNTLTVDESDPLFASVAQGSAVYFVHSYHLAPSDESIISARCEYGRSFCASLHRGNVFATQFHPEKSQLVGLRLLANFVAMTSSATQASAA